MKSSTRYFENRNCDYYPCHDGIDEMNCIFCFCPMYHMKDCPGNPSYIQTEKKILKSCMNCTFPHHAKNYDEIMCRIKAANEK